jgi:glyceraldehyde-3-phosphate dehydrogenase (ferredoxin)
MVQELLIDNLGICRFHRAWAEEMLPEIVGTVFGLREPFLQALEATASRLNSRNVSAYWEPERAVDYVQRFLERRREVDGDTSPELSDWIDRFRRDKCEAALEFWYELHKGTHESLREF